MTDILKELSRSPTWSQFPWTTMIKLRGSTYHLIATPRPGVKRIRRSLGTGNLPRAVEVAKTVLSPYLADDEVMGRAIVEARAQVVSMNGNGLILGEVWETYLRRSRSDGKTDKDVQSLGAVRSVWDRVVEYFGVGRNVYHLQESDVQEYVATLRGLAGGTIGNHIRTIKQILRCVLVRDFDHPFNHISTKVESDRLSKRSFNPDQVRSLLRVAGEVDLQVHHMWVLLLATGQRMTDVVCMKREQVNLDQDELIVAPGKTRKSNGKMIRIPLDFHVRQVVLDSMSAGGEYLFPGWSQADIEQTRCPLTRRNAISKANKRMLRIMDQVIPVEDAVVHRDGKKGVRVLGIHSFRATAVTWMAHLGCTPAKICEVTGHDPSDKVWRGYYDDEVNGGDVQQILATDSHIRVIDPVPHDPDQERIRQIVALIDEIDNPSLVRSLAGWLSRSSLGETGSTWLMPTFTSNDLTQIATSKKVVECVREC